MAYQTESEKKSYGGGGGVVHRGSSKNRGHKSDEKNQGTTYLYKSKFFIETNFWNYVFMLNAPFQYSNTGHSAYVETLTEPDGVKIDGFFYPNFM